MKVKAAIAWEAAKPLEIDEIDLEGPKAGEVLVRLKATGVCHTDAFTLSGRDPEGLFPSVMGHEGAGIVEEVGAGVTSVAPGDHVIPTYVPECRQCRYCLSGKTNLCMALRAKQGQGLMPDGTSRISTRERRSTTTWARRHSPRPASCRRSPLRRSAATPRWTRSVSSGARSPRESAQCSTPRRSSRARRLRSSVSAVSDSQ